MKSSSDIVGRRPNHEHYLRRLLIIYDLFKTSWKLLDTTDQRISASKRLRSLYRRANRCSSRWLELFSNRSIDSPYARLLGKWLMILAFVLIKPSGIGTEVSKPLSSFSLSWQYEVCGTDLHAYLAPSPKFPTSTEPDPITGESLPITLGHEWESFHSLR